MTPAEHTAIAGRSLILYDGVCGLCNRLVRLLIRIDRAGQLRFAPLESSLGIEILSRFPSAPTELEGIVLIANAVTPHETLHRRSDAILEALRRLHSPYPTFAILLHLAPKFLREWVYGLIARNRYRLFEKFDTCPIPTEAQRSRILGM
ncbi:thiol-disulfide oxidoreductase DCC family protein [Granulicella arctica]|uniref:Putative DCC family thiol-disulfide oxidoreductase YuxK n=1 Tax=Granulicella arctica TaxID=940613 RepID=A0A7Y9TJF9_9BACT|nr:DCC1-like thiol-disulfide oxidoreductase family protein [Granulicella arctica]NYF78237.1 putative DCC family thiol-disulfide oxidoreductase YuxK [Granulicella arctica]